MYWRYFLSVLLLGIVTVNADAQDPFTLQGTVFKKNSPDREANVSVTNQRTRDIILSDVHGVFKIPVKTGDTLLFKKLEYTPQLYVITSTLDINIYLQPILLLQTVTIKDESTKKQVADAMNNYKRTGQYYTLSPSAWSVINSPLSGLYEFFGTDPNRARRFREHSQEELEQIEVSRRYSNMLIKKITGMTTDKEVQAFKDVFTPAYSDIKTWSDYDVASYIKRSYEWYKKHKQYKLPALY